jgi:Flp pilus assembly protein TadB
MGEQWDGHTYAPAREDDMPVNEHVYPAAGESRALALDTELHPGWNRAQPEHIPRPTYWPAALALGITLLLWGLVSTPLLVLAGLVVFALALRGWIQQMRAEHEHPHTSQYGDDRHEHEHLTGTRKQG